MTTYLTNGTVAVTNGSTTVTGTDTDWATALVTAGMFYLGGGAYPIDEVLSNTSLTLKLPFAGTTGSGLDYAIGRSEAIQEQTIVNANRLAEILSIIPLFTPFGRSLVDDADASGALTTLGVSTFAKTILDDANAAAVRTTLNTPNKSGDTVGPMIVDGVANDNVLSARGTGSPLIDVWRSGLQKAILQANGGAGTVDLAALTEILRLRSGGFTGLQVRTDGVVDIPLIPCCLVVRSLGDSYSTGVVSWGSATLAQKCTWSGTSMVATHAGKYALFATMFASLPGALSNAGFSFAKNGSLIGGNFLSPAASGALGYCEVPMIGVTDLAIGDFVNVNMFYIASGGGLYGGGYSVFFAVKIG